MGYALGVVFIRHRQTQDHLDFLLCYPPGALQFYILYICANDRFLS